MQKTPCGEGRPNETMRSIGEAEAGVGVPRHDVTLFVTTSWPPRPAGLTAVHPPHKGEGKADDIYSAACGTGIGGGSANARASSA